MKAIEFDIHGIKCDNPNCKWEDMSVKFDPDYWLNKPCPKCGANLFTPQDYKTMKRIIKIAKVLNIIFWPIVKLSSKKEYKRLNVQMDGSGTATFNKIKEE